MEHRSTACSVSEDKYLFRQRKHAEDKSSCTESAEKCYPDRLKSPDTWAEASKAAPASAALDSEPDF